MDIETLEALGISKEELADRIINQAVDALLRTIDFMDEDGEAVMVETGLARRIEKLAVARIDAKVEELAAQQLMPRIDTMIDTLVIQQTTQWGEKRGKSMSVLEYIIERAEAFMVEPVDLNGRSKAEGDSYNWRQHSTRIAHAINTHLQFEIERAMKESLAVANTTMAKGLHEACRVAINEAAAKFAIVVKGG